MSGRRSAGGGAAAVSLLAELVREKQVQERERQNKAQDLYEKFAQEAVLDSIKSQIKAGSLTFDINTGKFIKTTPAPTPLKSADFLTPTMVSNMTAKAQPGMPLPATRQGAPNQYGERQSYGNIPVGPQGINSMNEIIRGGVAESPAATSVGRHLFSGNDIPEGPYVHGPNGTAIGGEADVLSGYGVLPRSSVLGILNSGAISAESSRKVRVRRLEDGKTGTILESDFDPKKYERIDG